MKNVLDSQVKQGFIHQCRSCEDEHNRKCTQHAERTKMSSQGRQSDNEHTLYMDTARILSFLLKTHSETGYNFGLPLFY